MLNDIGYGGEKVALSSGECKRDYEAEIKRHRTQKEKSEKLLNAIYDFIGFQVPYGRDSKLAEMIGELNCMIRNEDHIIEGLIELQEKEK